MINTIDLHANMFLRDMFRQNGWTNPSCIPLEADTPALTLLVSLGIPLDKVGVIYVNGKAYPPSHATLQPGDRVALFSPGAPIVVLKDQQIFRAAS
jgi:Mut7-C ubiquitin